jgi:pyruvate,water dikinase
MFTRYIIDLRTDGTPRGIGNKAERIQFLMNRGFRTPATFVCTWDAYLQYLEDHQDLVAALQSELSAKLDPGLTYAVRSSANVEDDLSHSFAGQFKSVLDVRGLDGVLEAIWSVWATAQSAGVQTYLERNGINPRDLKMAVIIQEMVNPVLSGVSFSKNPMTGLDEVVVEAVEGSGEILVQQGVTPKRWVNKWGDWIAKPDDDAELDVIQEIVDQTKDIAKTYGQPVDLEWVYDDHAIHWVQLREITSLDIDVYSNRISREVFPGIIKPLIWSINVPLVNGAWVKLFTELIGPNDIDPGHLAKPFYYRAYFNMGTIGQIFEMLGFPRESLELLMGLEIGGPDKPSFKPSARTYALLPRLLRFAVGMLGFGRRIEEFLPTMEARYKAFPLDQVDRLNAGEIMEEIERLYDLTQRTAYYNIVTPLLMQVYNRLLKSRLRRLGVDFESFDLTGDMEELEQFEPNVHLAALSQQYNELDEASRTHIRIDGYEACRQLPGDDPFRQGVEQFIEQFGHLSDSGNDFSSIPWREDPDLVLQMIVNYAPSEDGPDARVRFDDLSIPVLQRPLIEWLYRRARRFIFYREAIGSLYTFGYGLFRIYFLALGDRLARRGSLTSQEDIFYLNLDEVETIVDGDRTTDYQARIAERKQEIESYRDVTLPSIIYGNDTPPLELQTSDTLKGTPTSRGRYTGPVKVIRGIRDFDKLEEGDILTIPYSDVGWTPLFAKAGAVIAESGGLLSHSSIVAREYGIPAVVSVSGVCRIPDHTIVTVDGYRGEITFSDSDIWDLTSESPQVEKENVP